MRHSTKNNMTTTENIISELAQYQVQVKALKEETQEKMKALLAEMLQKFFTVCPEIQTITWYQYVPSFNDGDPCEFTMGSVEFSYELYGSDNDEGWDGDSFSVSGHINHKNLDPVVYSACVAVSDTIRNMDDTLQAMLGDNLSIYVTRGGIQTEEYCDY